jgi:hypothetical protein
MAKRKTTGGLMRNVTDAAGLTVGAVAAAKVSNINIPGPAFIRPLVPIVLGFFLMKRGGFLGNAGAGMVAVGGTKLLGQLAPNLGISATETVSDYVIEGAEDYALAGAEDYALAGNGEEPINAMNSSYALAGMDGEMNADFMG